MVRGSGRLTKWAVCLVGPPCAPVWPVCSLFFQSVSNFLPENKNVPPLPASSPLHIHHSTSLLNSSSIALPHLRWKFSHPPSRLPESAPPVSQPASASDQSRPATQHTAAAPSRPPRLNSSQPRHSRSLLPTSTVIPPRSHKPESSSALAPLSLTPSFTDCQQ